MDFVYFGAWNDEEFNRLKEHNSKAMNVKAFHRGKRVGKLGEGIMQGFGARVPKGGSKYGDGYRYFEGAEISTQGNIFEGINDFFNHAEVCFIIFFVKFA